MKFWGSLLLLLSTGCRASGDHPGVERHAYHLEAREQVDRLRVETRWHPVPMGGDLVGTWHELPQGSYVAQGWISTGACDRPRARSWPRHGYRPLPGCY